MDTLSKNSMHSKLNSCELQNFLKKHSGVLIKSLEGLYFKKSIDSAPFGANYPLKNIDFTDPGGPFVSLVKTI